MKYLLICLLLFLPGVNSSYYLNAEENSEKTESSIQDTLNGEKAETAAPASDEKTSVTEAPRKIEKAPAPVRQQAASPPPAPAPAAPPQRDEGGLSHGLLSIEDGDYMYSRIPDIVIDAPAVNPDSDYQPAAVSAGDESEGILSDSEKEKGLLGMTSSTTDLIVKIFFILLVLLIIILYRTRSNVSNSRVMRSIPKR